MKQHERIAIAGIKRDVNELKHRLINVQREVERYSPREADRLGTVIAQLELWQNTGIGAKRTS